MGTPSFAIVAEELLRLGAKQLIRVGTCGGIAPGLQAPATWWSPSPPARPTAPPRTYLHGDRYAPTADFALTHTLVHAAEEAGIPVRDRAGRIGRRLLQHGCRTTSASGATAGCSPSRWRHRSSSISPREQGIQAACLLTVSDVLNEEEGTEETYMSLEDLDAAVERMIEVALTAAVQSGP